MDRQYGTFIWDVKKELKNVRKHGVDFEMAARVFTDSKRKIYTDERHSEREERLFCIGKVGRRILTVRFTYRAGFIRIYGAGYWRNGRRYYEATDD